MAEFNSIMVDSDVAAEGVWQCVGPFDLKIAFAAFTNKEFQRTLKELTDPHRKAIEFNCFPAEKALELNHVAYARCIVKDWRGLEEGGKVLPYSVEKCVALFKGNPKVFELVQKMASDDLTFRVKSTEAAVGNSQTASATP